MRKILAPVLNYAIDKAKRNKFVQNLFEAPFELDKFPRMGSFTDSFGNSFELLDGLRTKLRPGWASMTSSKKMDITNEYLLKQKSNGTLAVEKILPLVKSLGKSVENCTILEIGCHSGATSFSLAESGASKVIGSEFSGYKVESLKKNKEGFENLLLEVNSDLKNIRTRLAKVFTQSEKVQFVDDDICNTALRPSSYDIICSWDVLEHLHDPEKAFASVYSLLKEDGISIHEYNPFFCLNGGHSLCTLDFLWGHTRLNESDFSDYLDKFRPDEKDRAMSFYQKGLNRMTLHDLKVNLEKSGLEIISILPFTKEQHLRMLDEQIISQTRMHYPNAAVLDLCTPRVYVLARKPGKQNLTIQEHLHD